MSDLKIKTVLVVDDMVAVRSALGQMLASLGIVKVEFASNGEECLRRVSTKPYDLILCDYYLGEGRDGMQVLEEGRHRRWIGLTTVFVMITAEASTAMVVGAVEHRPDDYLVKPITRQILQERIPKLIARKEILIDVERLVQEGKLEQAAQCAGEQAKQQSQYALDLMQVQVDLLLRIGEFDAARKVIDAAAALRSDTFWVKLARGQVCFYLGDYSGAKNAFNELIMDNLLNTDAYDWLAKVHQTMDDLPAAKDALAAAMRISPRSIRRAQVLGEVSLRTGDTALAEQAYWNAVRLGRFSVYCNPNDAGRLARLLAERGNYREASRIIKDARKQYQGDVRAILALSIAEAAYCHQLQLTAAAMHRVEAAINVYQDARNTLPPDLTIELARLCYAYNHAPQAAGIITDVVFSYVEDSALMQRAREIFKMLGMAESGEQFIHELWMKVAKANSTGVRLIQEGNLDAAQHFLENAANEMPFNPTINLNAARAVLLIIEKNGHNEELLSRAKKYLDEVASNAQYTYNDKFQRLRGIWLKLSKPEQISSPEWSEQSGVLLAWPHSESDWMPFLSQVEPVFTEIAAAIARFEKVLIIVQDERITVRVTDYLAHAGVAPERYRLIPVISDDTWTRDYGPITILEDGNPVLLDFRFNGWGAKYSAAHDDAVNKTLHAAGILGNTSQRQINLILEGGSIDVDGQGNLLTTESCLLTLTRNPELDQQSWERELNTHLGIARVLWLRNGTIIGDDTDGHIDTLARFCSPELIAYQSCTDTKDENYFSLQEMAAELINLRQMNGAQYCLAPLPWPRPHYADNGRRLPANYANFLIINHAVLVPQYNDPADEAALAIIQKCFPRREIIGINCAPLIIQNGSLHCVTMQIPAAVII